MIDNGNGTFTIRNKKTGEQKIVQRGELSQYGLSAPSTINNVDKAKTGAFENAIGDTGLYDIPVLGGIGRMLQHPVLNGAESTAEAVNSGLDLIKNIPNMVSGQPVPPYDRKFMSPESYDRSTGSLGEATVQGLKTGAGAASYAVPGGGMVGGLTMPGVAAAGGMSSFAETPNNLGDTATGTALGTLLGPLLAKLPGLAGKGASSTFEALTKKFPEGIRQNMDLVQKQLASLEEGKLSQTVGYKNRELAKQYGITIEDMPEDVLRKITPEMESVGEKLNGVLNQDYANTTIDEIRDAIVKAQKQTTPGLTKVSLVDFANSIDDFLRQNILDENPALVQGGPSALENAPVPLGLANKIKIRLGERFGDDPLYKQAYKNVQEIIERRSGDPGLIKELNKQYNALREIKDTASQRIEQGLTPMMRDYDIKRQQITNRPIVDPELSGAAAATAIGGAALGPVGSLPGGVWMTYRLVNNLLKNPEYAAKLAGIMESPRALTDSAAGQTAKKGTQAVGKVLEQIGLKLPSTFYQQ